MRILLAPNSFKESLSAWDAATAMEKGIRRVLPRALIYKIPIADGGSGTVDAIVRAAAGSFFKARVTGPLGEKLTAAYGILETKDKTGIVEMASASGLRLIPPNKRDPGLTTTFGTGELIKACLDRACGHIMVGLGDSATTDGGVGMAQALGIRFIDRHGKGVGLGGKNLKNICHIEIDGLDKRIKNTKITILSDVKNPLCGPKGAARVFSPQKGASPAMVQELEKGLEHLAKLIKQDLGIDIKDHRGAGAAGGAGGGMMAFLGGESVSGVDVVLELTNIKGYIRKADIVITGEGKLDRQTIYGKAPMGVARLASQYKKPVFGIAGAVGEGSELLYKNGFTSVFSIIERPMTLEGAIKESARLLANASERIMRLLLTPIYNAGPGGKCVDNTVCLS